MTSESIQPCDRSFEDADSTAKLRAETRHQENDPSLEQSDTVARTLAVAATSGIAGAAVGHLIGGRIGATIGAVVGGVAGAAIGSDAIKDDFHLEGVVDTVKDASEHLKALATDAGESVKHATKQAISSHQPSLGNQNSLVPAQTHHRLGVILGRQGKLDEAIEEFHETLYFTPDSAEAHYNLGIAFSKQGDFQRGLGYLQQAETLCTEQGKIRRARAINRVVQFIEANRNQFQLTRYSNTNA